VTIANTLVKISSFSLLLYLFIFTYTILGMEMFAHTLRFTVDNKKVDYFDNTLGDLSLFRSKPDSNFDSFWNGTLLVFIVLANDGWTTIYFEYFRVVGGSISTLFFVSLVILG
jgi:hypothetical protein